MTMPPLLRLGKQPFAVHGDIAAGIGASAADHRDIDGERWREQQFLTGQLDELDDVLGGGGVQSATAVAGVDERAEADRGDGTGPTGGDVAQQVRQRALGQAVRLDLFGDRHVLHALGPAPVPADDPPHHALVSEAVYAAAVRVPHSGDVHHGEVAWVGFCEEARLDPGQNRRRFVDPTT